MASLISRQIPISQPLKRTHAQTKNETTKTKKKAKKKMLQMKIEK